METRMKNKTWDDWTKNTGERRKTKKIPRGQDQTIKTKQASQNNEKHLKVGGEFAKPYPQPDAREA